MRHVAHVLIVLFLAGSAAGADPKTFKSVEEMLAGIPKDAYPLPGDDGAPERKAAENWLKHNLSGGRVEWTATVKHVRFAESGDKVTVSLTFDLQPYNTDGGLTGIVPWKPTLKDRSVRAFLQPNQSRANNFLFKNLTAEEAKTIRDMKDKQVTAVASIQDIRCVHEGLAGLDGALRSDNKLALSKTVMLIVTVNPPMLNGLLPESLKPYYKQSSK